MYTMMILVRCHVREAIIKLGHRRVWVYITFYIIINNIALSHERS